MREMMSTGLSWIKNIPTEWRVIPNKYIFSKIKNVVGCYNGEPVLSLTINGVKIRNDEEFKGKKAVSYDDYQVCYPGNLLMCLFDIDVTPRCIGLIMDNGLTTSAYTQFVVADNNDPKYYYYYYLSLDYTKTLLHMSRNIRSSLTADDFGRIYTIQPPFSEQQAIVRYLDSKYAAIDEAIDRHRKIIAKIDNYRQTLITMAVTKGIYGDRLMKNCDECLGGTIPSDWDFIRIKWLLDKSHPYPLGDGDHGSIKADAYKESGIPFIRVQNLGWGTDIKTDNIVYISEEQNETIKNSTLRPNDILFAKTGATVGKTAIIPSDMPISNTTSHIGKITVSPEYNPRYVFYVLSSNIGYKQLWDFAEKKATRPEVAIAEMKELKITLPRSRKEQDDIVSFLDKKMKDLFSLTKEKQSIITKLEEYRKSIIYNAVTGKIDCRTEV